MIHTTENFFNKVANDIRQTYFENENDIYSQNRNHRAATYAIELFNNGCITYRTFIGRLAKSCDTNNATIHMIVEKHIVSFGQYQYKPRQLYSQSKKQVI